MQRRLLSLALAVAIAAGVPGAGGRASAASPQSLPLGAAIRTLQSYGVVDKVPEADLRLDQTISRAEMAKVLGAALNLQKAAEAAKDASPFADTAGHWAAGWIAVARERGLFAGRDDGLFHPQDPVTYAEVVTVLLRLTGRGLQATNNWPWGAIATAADYGMIPTDMDLAGRWHEPATRAGVFRLTAVAIGRTPLSGTQDTLLQNQGDRTPPVLELTRIPAVTGEWRPTVAGQVTDAVTLFANGSAVDIQPDGGFTAQVDLKDGNNAVTFVAVDGAGNRTERVANILLQPLAGLEMESPLIETSAGQPFTPVVLRYDAAGNSTTATALTWTYDATVFKRDLKTGAFTASTPGEYTLRASTEGAEVTAKVLVAGAPARVEVTTDFPTLVAGGAPVPVSVRVLDAEGRLVTAGSHQVQLSALPAQGATFDQQMVTTVRGQAKAYLSPGQSAGGLGIQAVLTGASKAASPVVPLSVEPRRVAGIELSASPPNVKPYPGQNVTIVATTVDQVGVPIAVREDTTIGLSASAGDVARLTRGTVVIRTGNSSSDAADASGLAVTTGASGSVTFSGSKSGLTVTPVTFRSASSGDVAALEVRIVREAAMADKLSAAIVSVTRRDSKGELVAFSGQVPVVLFSKATSVNISQVSDQGGVAVFAVRAGSAGRVEVTAGVPGRSDLNSRPVTVAFARATVSARPVIRTSARTASPGDPVTAYIALEAGNGQIAANPGPPLRFTLSAPPGVSMTATELVIPTGATRSGDSIITIPTGITNLSLGGAMIGGDALPAATVSVATRPPASNTPTPTGPNLIAIPAQTGRPPVAGEDVRFTVRARRGAYVDADSYAFGVGIRINNEPVSSPIPELTIKVGSTSLAPGDTVRTTDGEAVIWVRYTGTGTLQLEPLPATDVDPALDQWGVDGPASATPDWQTIAGKVTYSAGQLQRLDVQVTPNLGTASQGIIKAARGRFATVRLTPVDQYGNAAGSNCLATLTRVHASPEGALVLRAPGADVAEQSISIGASGYAEFTVAATTDRQATSDWSPIVVCGTTPLTAPQNVTVSATIHSAPTPEIEFAGGPGTSGDLDGDDPGLDLRIAQLSGAPTTAELLVYEDDTLLGRFGPVQARFAAAGGRTVRIPTTVFGGSARSIRLRVRIHSGSDVSEESDPVYVYYSP
ncbi:MAG TPA: S-layer homology domain-containing protein [Symbiobacteriaceae bacterium]|nr:S-layer homology domain-containing protein [Symbiobacteriaceae bacterium]